MEVIKKGKKMSLPYSSIVPISATVSSPAFGAEKKHMCLVVNDSLIPTSVPYFEFSGASAVSDVGNMFGVNSNIYDCAKKYFGFLSKTGTSPEKMIVVPWYKRDNVPFIKTSRNIISVSELKKITDGTMSVYIGEKSPVADYNPIINLDFSSIRNYHDAAIVMQTAISKIRTGDQNYSNAIVEYNDLLGRFVFYGGKAGKGLVYGILRGSSDGTELTDKIGIFKHPVDNQNIFLNDEDAEFSEGVNAETFAECCDRIYNMNTGAFSITTINMLSEQDIYPAVEWLNTVSDGQTINTMYKLVFRFTDIETAKAVSSTLDNLGYTGYVITWDPNSQYINVLDCAICGSIDYQVENGAINFNLQPATGYTSVTGIGNVIDYQNGQTNVALMEDLEKAKISTVYSVGFGSQEQNFYGLGLMAGSFGSEDIQVNESALEQSIQLSIINAMASLNKIKMQGSDANAMISSLIAEPLELFKRNGTIATNGTLTQADRISIAQATGNNDAADSVARNGYYFKIQDITNEDIKARQVRVLIIYLAAGVVNKVRVINRIYGA